MIRNPSYKMLSLLLLLGLLACVWCARVAHASPSTNAPTAFRSPEEAVKQFVAAVRSRDKKEAARILGPGSRQILSSGDPVADRADREAFLRLYDEKNTINMAQGGRAVLTIGKEDFPFAIPVVKRKNGWVFDTRAGREELLNRRIGRNELAVIDLLKAYVDAQRDYAARQQNGGGIPEFARKIRSTPGKRDGLYWEVKAGEEDSPFGPLAAKAAREGYLKSGGGEAVPYHGYFFRILKGQGKNAEGGAYDYVVNGRMVLGFAMVAYPAEYGASGVMTFIVNQSGIVYQKDFGGSTGKIAAAVKLYDPGKGWTKVRTARNSDQQSVHDRSQPPE